jgi:hypothetical protein
MSQYYPVTSLSTEDRKRLILEYVQLGIKLIKGDSKADPVCRMEAIRKELGMTNNQIIAASEKLLK